MARLVASDAGTFHAANHDTGQSMLRMIPEDIFTHDEVAYFFAHPEEMPLVADYKRTGTTHARRMSDVNDLPTLTKTRYYENGLRRSGLRYFLTLPLHLDDSTVAGLAFNRRKNDFTLRDRALLDGFGPHVILAWARHGDPWKVHSPFRRLKAFRRIFPRFEKWTSWLPPLSTLLSAPRSCFPSTRPSVIHI